LLLNVPPNRDGLIDEADRLRLLELAGELRRRFAEPIAGSLDQRDGAVVVDFGEPVAFDHLVLREDLVDGQRIDGCRVITEPNGREIARGTTIGSQIFVVTDEIRTSRLRIELGSDGGRLGSVTAHRTGCSEFPTLDLSAQ
jgi:alpha-L-fucosidase